MRRSRRSKCRPQTTLSEQKEAKNKSTKVSASSVFSPSSVRFCILFCHPKVNRDNESNTFILLLSPFSRSSPIPFLYLFCDPDLLLVLHLPYPILHFILKQKQPENESTKAASFLLSLFSIVFGILLCEPKQFSSLIFFFSAIFLVDSVGILSYVPEVKVLFGIEKNEVDGKCPFLSCDKRV